VTGADKGSVEALHDLSGDQCLILVRRFEEAVALLQQPCRRGDLASRADRSSGLVGRSNDAKGSDR
jgi:hypothetical protein